MSLPLLVGLSALAVALVGWLAWFAGRRAALREADEELRGVRFQHAAELRRMRRDLVLEREKAKKAEDFSEVIVRARDDDTTRLRRDAAERTRKLEADNVELREVLLLAKQEIDRLRARVAELDWASTPSRKGGARPARGAAPSPAAVPPPHAEGADVEIEVDLSMAEEPSLPGDDTRPAPVPEEPPPAPFDDTAGTVFVRRETREEAAVALPARQPEAPAPEPATAPVAAATAAPPEPPEPAPAAGEETADRERSAEVSRAVEAALAHEVEPLPPAEVPPPAAEEPPPMSVALPLEAIRGIGPAVAKALRAAGIDTLEALAAAPPAEVRAAVPKRSRDRAEEWVLEAKAILAAELAPPGEPAGELVGVAAGGGELPDRPRPAGRKRRRR